MPSNGEEEPLSRLRRHIFPTPCYLPLHVSLEYEQPDANPHSTAPRGQLNLLATDGICLYLARTDGRIDKALVQPSFQIVDTYDALWPVQINQITCVNVAGSGRVLIALGGPPGVPGSGVVWIKWLNSEDFVKVRVGESAWAVDVHEESGLIVVGTNEHNVILLRILVLENDLEDEKENMKEKSEQKEGWRETLRALEEKVTPAEISLRNNRSVKLLMYGRSSVLVHRNNIPSVAISPDCEYFASVSIDHTVSISPLASSERESGRKDLGSWLWGVKWIEPRSIKTVHFNDPLFSFLRNPYSGGPPALPRHNMERIYKIMCLLRAGRGLDEDLIKMVAWDEDGKVSDNREIDSNSGMSGSHELGGEKELSGEVQCKINAGLSVKEEYCYPMYSDDRYPDGDLDENFVSGEDVYASSTKFEPIPTVRWNGQPIIQLECLSAQAYAENAPTSRSLSESLVDVRLVLVTGWDFIGLYSFDVYTGQMEMKDQIRPLSCEREEKTLANRFGLVEYIPELSLAVCAFQRHGHILLIRVMKTMHNDETFKLSVERTIPGTACSGDEELASSRDYVVGMCVLRRYSYNCMARPRTLTLELCVMRMDGRFESYMIQRRTEESRLDITACLL